MAHFVDWRKRNSRDEHHENAFLNMNMYLIMIIIRTGDLLKHSKRESSRLNLFSLTLLVIVENYVKHHGTFLRDHEVRIILIWIGVNSRVCPGNS